MFFNRKKTHHIGQHAELLSRHWLQQQGLTLVAANSHGPRGEIDLIMMDQQQLVFIEVRFRRNASYGSAADSVDHRKQQKIINTAEYFLTTHPKYANFPCRFDVVTAQPGSSSDKLRFSWIKNAFLQQ